MRIVVTGMIASGKSLALEYLERHGFYTIQSDAIAREICSNECGDTVLDRVYTAFIQKYNITTQYRPKTIEEFLLLSHQNGYSADLVWDKLNIIDSIMHPMVQKVRENIINTSVKSADQPLAMEIPLFFPYHSMVKCDYLFYIYSKKRVQKRRYVQRVQMKLDNVDIARIKFNILRRRQEHVMKQYIRQNKMLLQNNDFRFIPIENNGSKARLIRLINLHLQRVCQK